MLSFEIKMVACDGCKKKFYVDSDEEAVHCTFCGEKKKTYDTYVLDAKPLEEDIVSFNDY